MKKLLLLCLVALGGVMNASAQELYLHNSSNWGAYPSFANKGTNPSNTSETIWEYVLNSSSGLGEGDFYFRLKYSDYGDDLGPNWCKNGGNDYTYQWKVNNVYNGQWETYEIKHGTSDSYNFWGANSAFCIEHSKIKAKEYKITVYANRGTSYFVKVEIVSMPATVSGLGFSTFSCDRALDLDNATGITAAYKASVNNGKVVLTKVTGKVAEGTGLLLAGTTGSIPVVTKQEGIDISSTNLLKASVTNTEVAASTTSLYHYFLAGTDAASLGFYNLESNATSSAGKAYLETTTELTYDPATSRVAWIFADNNATGINTLQNVQKDDVLYDLQGRVAKTAKAGLYIKNGKKVFVK